MTSEIESIEKREKKLAQQRGDFFSPWLGFPCSLPITRFFLRHDISENIATMLMWWTGMLGSLLLLPGLPWSIVGFSLLMLQLVLDYVDGQLARHRGTASVRGAVWDRWSHFMIEMFFYAMLATSLYYQHGSPVVFIPVAVLVIWNRFRVLISGLPTLIYCNEMTCYPDIESRMMRHNLGAETASDEEKTAKDEPHLNKLSWLRCILRSTTTSFNFLILVLLFAAIAEFILALIGHELPLVFLAVLTTAVYYAYNIIDYSYDYLFTDRIETDIVALSKRLRSEEKENR